MASPVFELDISEEWWIWRGYLPYIPAEERSVGSPELELWENDDGHTYFRRCDPIDERDFSEERAFPLITPAIDVFGVPLRSRKQRGWYQVVHPAPVISLENAVLQPLHSAVEFPPEIISRIADAAIGGNEPDPELEWSSHELSSYAMVCRHWANVVQPRLFQRVTVNSHREITQLLNIHRTSLTKLAQHGTLLELMDKLGNEPFAHLATDVRPDAHLKHLLVISGPLPPNCGSRFRSIHALLPRSLPPSRVLRLSRLVMQDIHFRFFTDLIQLVWELPVLTFLQGTRLTWESESVRPGALLAWVAARRSKLRSSGASMEACTPHQHCLTLLLTGVLNFHRPLGDLVRHIDEQLAGVREFQIVFNFSASSNICESSMLSMSAIGS